MIANTNDIGGVFVWGGLLLAAVIALGAAVWWIRRRLFAGDEPDSGDIWSLQHLRELRRTGQLTEDEFQKLKAQVIAQFSPPGDESEEDAQVPP